MNDKRRSAVYVIYMILGAVLLTAGLLGKVDEFWSGMGSGLLCVGVLQLLRRHRINRNEAYREKVETAQTDERNHFIRNKAWAWAGYLFVISNGFAVIVLKVMGQELLSMAASFAICLMLNFYWVSYTVLKRKY